MNYNTTKVFNAITGEISTYYNGYDLETNLISTIVCQEDANKLLHDKFREKITEIDDKMVEVFSNDKYLLRPLIIPKNKHNREIQIKPFNYLYDKINTA